MHSCRRPFQDCASICDRCTTPVIDLPPPHEPLRSKMAMLAFTGGMFAIIALVSLSGIPERWNDVNRQYKEDVR